MISLATLVPYLLVAGGYAIRHFNILGKAASLLGVGGASATPTKAGMPTINVGAPGSHPVLSDAVNAAIKQAVSDVVSGHVSSIKSEIKAAVSAAVAAAVADLKAKV